MLESLGPFLPRFWTLKGSVTYEQPAVGGSEFLEVPIPGLYARHQLLLIGKLLQTQAISGLRIRREGNAQDGSDLVVRGERGQRLSGGGGGDPIHGSVQEICVALVIPLLCYGGNFQ